MGVRFKLELSVVVDQHRNGGVYLFCIFCRCIVEGTTRTPGRSARHPPAGPCRGGAQRQDEAAGGAGRITGAQRGHLRSASAGVGRSQKATLRPRIGRVITRTRMATCAQLFNRWLEDRRATCTMGRPSIPRSGSAWLGLRTTLYAGSTLTRVPRYRSAWTAELGKRGLIYRRGSLAKGTTEAHRSPRCSAKCVYSPSNLQRTSYPGAATVAGRGR
jgi:hypothetical protein